jgi:hypothetical protein
MAKTNRCDYESAFHVRTVAGAIEARADYQWKSFSGGVISQFANTLSVITNHDERDPSDEEVCLAKQCRG